jgi:Transmembrane secretion effector
VRLSRLRTGATQWGLFREGEAEDLFVEIFAVPSWEEHERQHAERQTETDYHYLVEASALSETMPETSHLISAKISEQ